MRRKRRKNKQTKFIIFASLSLLFILTVGYAAFSTNLNIAAKGNVVVTKEECFTISDNGDGTAAITNYDESCGQKVKIPKTIKGLTVTSLADGTGLGAGATGPFTRKNVTTVILPDTITYIGSIAFFQSKLTKINFPSSLKTINFQAFGYAQLEEVELNEGLETIEQEAFTNNNLKSIKIPNTVKNLGDGVATSNLMEGENAYIYDKDSNGNEDKTKLNSYGNRNGNTVTIPSNIKTLGSLSIYHMKEVTQLNIPNTVENLESRFVYNMENLTTINLGNGIKNIDDRGFAGSGLTQLKTININRKTNAITGSPWGVTWDGKTVTINWTGTN